MKFTLLDMVWPALYVSETFWHFWFLVIGTIIIELFVIKHFLKFSWMKSVMVSLIGNCVSGFIGTFIMMWGMIFWHLIADRLVPHATFDIINWIATYVLMCLGSVLLETLAIKLIYKEKIKKLFLPMLVGNFLSYSFIAFVMLTATDKDPDEVAVQVIKYLPNTQDFVLLDNDKLHIDTCSISVSLDENNVRINDTKNIGYNLQIPFKKEIKGSFQFEFKILGDEYGNGMYENSADLRFTDLKNEYKIVIEQKNPDPNYGWTKPIITDTLTFKRLTK